jgi:hypothetical protein
VVVVVVVVVVVMLDKTIKIKRQKTLYDCFFYNNNDRVMINTTQNTTQNSTQNTTPILISMLYPLEHLRVFVDDDDQVWGLTPEDRHAIQCAHLWLRAYTCPAEAHPPPSPRPTYTDLWYMLKYFQQIQILVNTLPSNFDHILDAHAQRYAALLATHYSSHADLPHLSYRDVREWPVVLPLAIASRCARDHPLQQPR